LTNEFIQHLLLETEWSNGEVKDTNLYRSLWGVVRVWNGCSHEESEVFVVLYLLLSNSQVSTLVDLLKQNWFKSWI